MKMAKGWRQLRTWEDVKEGDQFLADYGRWVKAMSLGKRLRHRSAWIFRRRIAPRKKPVRKISC